MGKLITAILNIFFFNYYHAENQTIIGYTLFNQSQSGGRSCPVRAKNPRLNFRSPDCSDCSHSKFGRNPQSHQISTENCPSSTGCCLIAVDFKLSKTINRIILYIIQVDYVQAVVLFPRLVKFSTVLVNCKFNEGFKLSFLTLAWPFPTEGFAISGS